MPPSLPDPLPSALAVYKPPGFSPLQILDRLRVVYPKLRDEVLAYAGRLDPLAEGVLIVLVGDAARRIETHTRLDKRYRVTVLFGYATDSYDPLGLVTHTQPGFTPARATLEQHIARLVGTSAQPYPPFSSALSGGRPLFYWARKGLAAPTSREPPLRTVYSATLLETHARSAETLRAAVHARVRAVRGDFRQDAILARWDAVLSEAPGRELHLAELDIACSTGTYMRSLAHGLGEQLGGCALAWRIVRTQAGDFTAEKALRVTDDQRP